MRNPGYEADSLFREIEDYKDRFVAFVDVMGVKNRMREVDGLNELLPLSKLMYKNSNQPFAEGKINAVVFSDCMYFVSEGKYLNQLICLLANFAYNLLVNRENNVEIKSDGSIESTIDWNCFKLRGGITYGKVVALDEETKKRGLPYGFNMVIGPAAIQAYELESIKAVYPRIIVDEAFLEYCRNEQISLNEYNIIRDTEKDHYYLDFWDYMFKGDVGPSDFLNGCIAYVREELKDAKSSGNAKLSGQLYWYIEYLERHRKINKI